MLTYFFVENLEVPFIWEHRRDYIVFYRKDEDGNVPAATDGGAGGLVRLLDRNELWKVYELGTKYRALMKRKEGLDATWAKLWQRRRDAWAAEQDVQVDDDGAEIPLPADAGPERTVFDRYFDEKVDGPGGLAEDGVEGVQDAHEWVGIRYGRELREIREEEDEEMKARGERRRQKRTNEGAIKRAGELREGRAGTALRVRLLPPLCCSCSSPRAAVSLTLAPDCSPRLSSPAEHGRPRRGGHRQEPVPAAQRVAGGPGAATRRVGRGLRRQPPVLVRRGRPQGCVGPSCSLLALCSC